MWEVSHSNVSNIRKNRCFFSPEPCFPDRKAVAQTWKIFLQSKKKKHVGYILILIISPLVKQSAVHEIVWHFPINRFYLICLV